MPDVRLETERLILREIEEPDWVGIHCYATDHEVVRFMNWGPNTEDETRAFIASAMGYKLVEPRKEIQLAMVSKDGGRLIGAIGIWRKDGDSLVAEIGYCLNRDYWGQGYMTEAARAVVAFGFNTWGMHRVFARLDPENIASKRVAEKIGMSLEGHIREDHLLRGEWRDFLVFGVLEDEWRR